MIQQFRHHIGVKLFVSLIFLIFLAIAPLAYVVLSTVSYFGNYTTAVNRDEIQSQATSYLATIAREQAHKYDAFFSHVEVASSIMAAQAREVYNNLEYYAGLPDERHKITKDGEKYINGILPELEVIAAYSKSEHLLAQDKLERQALHRLDPVFKGVQKEIPESSGVHMVTVTGIYRYLHHKEESSGIVSDHVIKTTYDQSINDALTFFSENPEPAAKGTVWTQVYRNPVNGSLQISASSRVVDRNGVLRAAIGVDIPLEKVLGELLDLDSNRYDQINETLFSFLLDDSGRIIAFPKKYFELFGIHTGAGGVDSDIYNLRLANSTVAAIPPIVTELMGAGEEPIEVQLKNGAYTLHIHALHRLNWNLVLVAQHAEMLTSVKRSEQALSGTIQILVHKFAVNAVVVVLILLVVVFLAVGYFVAPLKKLSEAALAVGRGDLKTRCHLDRMDELGILADSFNDMVLQLETAEKVKKNQAQQLELTVQERTRDLREKNFVLRDVIGELNAESERRKSAVEALERSEKQIRIIIDASLAGHGIIQDGKIMYANTMGSRVFGFSRKEMMSGNIEVAELIATIPYARIQKELLERFTTDAGKPYVIECRRKDGTIFDALVGGAVTTWEGKPAIVATVMDISDQKRSEEELRKSKALLQESLAEKEVLLREIYHRTKNNMLVIISMLHLQAMDIDDQKVKTLFWETENRIRAMSLVHEKLYQSQNLTEIDLGHYLNDMVAALVSSMVIGDQVKLEMKCEQIAVSIDNIVPLGLAINEIVTNSLKHAFPGNATGRIFLHLSHDVNGMTEVSVGDDGIGLPPDMDLGRIRTFGMQIAFNLITKQLRGSMDIQRDKGTVYRIRFAESVRPKRI